MARNKTANKAPKTKATTKAAQLPKETKNVQTSPRGDSGKDKKPAGPKWLKPFPVDYIVGTEDYACIIQDHNDKFDTMYNRWRVQPAVFFTIHATIWNHYHDKK